MIWVCCSPSMANMCDNRTFHMKVGHVRPQNVSWPFILNPHSLKKPHGNICWLSRTADKSFCTTDSLKWKYRMNFWRILRTVERDWWTDAAICRTLVLPMVCDPSYFTCVAISSTTCSATHFHPLPCWITNLPVASNFLIRFVSPWLVKGSFRNRFKDRNFLKALGSARPFR